MHLIGHTVRCTGDTGPIHVVQTPSLRVRERGWAQDYDIVTLRETLYHNSCVAIGACTCGGHFIAYNEISCLHQTNALCLLAQKKQQIFRPTV